MSILSIALQGAISYIFTKAWFKDPENASNADTLGSTPPDKFYVEKANAILGIIERYRLLDNVPDLNANSGYKETFLPLIARSVRSSSTIQFVLPAFPFKSPNSIDKVLGVLPDKAEELSLALLQGLCDSIRDVYEPGAKLTIVSDGIVYSDLLGVSDEVVWNYGEELRRMAADADHKSIGFARMYQISDVIKVPREFTTDLDATKYQTLAPLIRRELVSAFCSDEFDVKKHIESDENVMMTYRGYIKYLSTDLAHTRLAWDESPYSSSASNESKSVSSTSSSKSSRKRYAQRVAKQMITRGKCFAELVRQAYPDAVRLSIHASKSSTKISVGVIPGLRPGKPMTPWHCTVVCGIDGSFTPAKRSELQSWPRAIEPVYSQGRLWCYRESSEIYDWGEKFASFDHKYPCGLLITALQPGTQYSSVPMDKLRQLAELTSPVTLRRFEGADNEEKFLSKGREMGEIQRWKFGELLRVKDVPSNNGGLNNVLSAEPMPMHYDGLFKIVDGVPKPPLFQIFTTPTGSPKGIGRTLFASSRLLFQHLPSPCTLESIRNLTWGVETSAFEAAHLTKLPLVSEHHSTKLPVLRYHEHWPKERTAFDPSLVTIEGVSEDEAVCIRKAIEEALYDRRVCTRIEWEKGDVIVSDNVSMMHTREGFNPKQSRELWRIHVD